MNYIHSIRFAVALQMTCYTIHRANNLFTRSTPLAAAGQGRRVCGRFACGEPPADPSPSSCEPRSGEESEKQAHRVLIRDHYALYRGISSNERYRQRSGETTGTP